MRETCPYVADDAFPNHSSFFALLTDLCRSRCRDLSRPDCFRRCDVSSGDVGASEQVLLLRSDRVLAELATLLDACLPRAAA